MLPPGAIVDLGMQSTPGGADPYIVCLVSPGAGGQTGERILNHLQQRMGYDMTEVKMTTVKHHDGLETQEKSTISHERLHLNNEGLVEDMTYFDRGTPENWIRSGLAFRYDVFDHIIAHTKASSDHAADSPPPQSGSRMCCVPAHPTKSMGFDDAVPESLGQLTNPLSTKSEPEQEEREVYLVAMSG